jgi:outer membrane lipoprotein-sorting protein
MSNGLWVKTFIFLLFLLPSCAPKMPPRVSVPESEQVQVLKEVKAYLNSLQSIRSAKGFAKVRLKASKGRGNFDEAVIIRLPASFRFETLDDFGKTRFLVTSDGSSLDWQDLSRKEYSTGEMTDERVRRLIPLAHSLEETLGLFIGKIKPPDLTQAVVTRQKSLTEYRIEFLGGELIWDRENHAIVSFASKGEDGKVAFQYRGSEFKEKPSIKIPSRVWLKDFKTKKEIEIHYQDLELNPVISESLFKLYPQPDARRLDEMD